MSPSRWFACSCCGSCCRCSSRHPSRPRRRPPLLGARKLLHLASDEYRVAAWALLEDGTLDVFKLDGDGQAANEQMESRKLFADGPAMTAAAFSLTSEDAALGFADGSIRVGTIGFVTRFIDEDQLGETARNLKPGEAKVVDSGLIQRTPEGQLRRQEISVKFGPPFKGPAASAITHIDLTMRPAGPVICTRSADGQLHFNSLKPSRSLESDETTYRLRSARFAVGQRSEAGRAASHAGFGRGRQRVCRLARRRLLRYDVRNFQQPKLAEELDMIAEPDVELTALEFMIGKTTLAAGDSSGRVSGWFRVNTESAQANPTGAPGWSQRTGCRPKAARSSRWRLRRGAGCWRPATAMETSASII